MIKTLKRFGEEKGFDGENWDAVLKLHARWNIICFLVGAAEISILVLITMVIK